MTKTFKNMAAQGDVLIRKIDKLPEGLVPGEEIDNNFILGHSETGHSHVVKKQKDIKFYQSANDNFIAYLVVDNNACVEHMRSFDTHESISLKQGIYEIRRQREYSPQGWRRVAD